MSDSTVEIKSLIAELAGGAILMADEAMRLFGLMMSGDLTPAQTGAVLMALRVRGESVGELAAGARVLREKMVRVSAPVGAIDTCGTGGDGSGTLNISTAAALVVAAAGVPVAKHGNRSLSSKSGSSEVLHELGVNIELSPDDIRHCIDAAGIGFMMAPRHHGAMRHVAGARMELGTRTIFNLLGPLCNPAGVRHQLLGVFDGSWTMPLAEVLHELGSERAWVIHGHGGLDEMSLTGPTEVAELKDGKVTMFAVKPEDAGIEQQPLEALKGGDPAFNARAIRLLLDGSRDPSVDAFRSAVLLSASAALVVAERASNLKDGVDQAAMALDDGAAAQVLNRLVEASNRNV